MSTASNSTAPNSELPTPNSSSPTPDSELAPPPPPTGRPRALDATRKNKILTLLATGSSLAEAARYVRCSVSTARREMRRDHEFATLIEHAEQRADADPLKAIYRAAKKSWRAGVYLLERNEARRDARKDSQYQTISQLKSCYHALAIILKTEVRDDMYHRRLSFLFDAALGYTIREVAEGRKPYHRDISEAAFSAAKSSGEFRFYHPPSAQHQDSDDALTPAPAAEQQQQQQH